MMRSNSSGRVKRSACSRKLGEDGAEALGGGLGGAAKSWLPTPAGGPEAPSARKPSSSGTPWLVAQAANGVHRLRAEAAAHREVVDDAIEADVVRRVIEQAEDGQDVFDLFALVEPDSADDSVGDVADAERFFHHAALGGRPVHHRDLVAADTAWIGSAGGSR